MKKHIYVIGVGVGGLSFLTQHSADLLKKCEELYSTKRIASIFHEYSKNVAMLKYSEIIPAIKSSNKETIGILVSGDTGFFSISKKISDELADVVNIEFSPGISSMQYFFAKLRLSYEDVKIVSLHGRSTNILGAVTYNRHVFALTGGDGSKVEDICKELSDNGLGSVNVAVGENLSLNNERIFCDNAKSLVDKSFDDLSVILIENKEFISKHKPYKDSQFIRGNVPMTKEEVRHVIVSKLAPEPDDIVFDIGSGTGSVSLELARLAYDGVVYAIDCDDEAIKLTKENVLKIKCHNVKVINANAIDVIKNLPTPNKVFIGGSGGYLREICDILFNVNKCIKITISAITLETLNMALDIFKSKGVQAEIVCLNVSHAKKAGSYNMMVANNPIYIVSGEAERC